MDIIKFNNPTAALRMQQGEILNGLSSIMWIERYRDAGEFKIEAPVSAGLRTKIPPGTFLSHLDTSELMVVENHEIKDDIGKDPIITVTGRSFETILSQRIVGSNLSAVPNVGSPLADYDVPTGTTWVQATNLINNHIGTAALYNDDNAFPYVVVSYSGSLTQTSQSTVIGRKLKRGDLYKAVIDIIEDDNLGIKIFRPGTDSPIGSGPNTLIYFHSGVDRGNNVIFAYIAGEIVNADYLWSNKTLKNAALCSGKWMETVIYSAQYGAAPAGKEYTRRMMFVDCTDIDSYLTGPPSTAGGMRQEFEQYMQDKGRAALRKQNEVALAKAEITKNATKHIYRKDYDVGDLVRVAGDFNEWTTMRVSEYVEMEDETGESGYPTLVVETSN